MSRFLAAPALGVVLLLAACGAPASAAPSPASSPTPVATPPPTDVPSPTDAPSPAPTVSPVVTPAPSGAPPTANERYLLDGVRRGAVDCAAVRDGLPGGAVAGIECGSSAPAVARIGFYLFANDEDMLDGYVARMTAEGVKLDSGSCRDGEREGPYTPGDGLVPFRNGCFINDAGFANYRATLPGPHVYIGILGRTRNMAALEDFAWVGNQDVPGNPTLWADPG